MMRGRFAALALLLALSLYSPAVATPGVAGDSLASATGAAESRSSVVDSTVNAAAGAIVPGATPSLTGSGPDYIAQVREGFTPKNREYSRFRVGFGILAPLFSILVSVLLLFTGVAARVRDLALRGSSRHYVRVLIVVSVLTLIVTAIELPIAWFRGFFLEHRFGLSTQSFTAWLADLGKDAVVGILLYGATGLLALAYRVMEKRPNHWWVAFGLGTLPVILAGTFLQPLVLDPLYNKFSRLSDRNLEQKILALAERAGIPARRVFEVDKSRQTIKYNAYVTGFGASQRIVLWDTTLKGMEQDEILFILGHEIGHYRLGHIFKGIALYAVGSFALFFLVRLLMLWGIARFGPRWRIDHVHDLATVPLLTASLTLVGFVAEPITNACSRQFEREADVYAIEITRDNDAGARAFLKLGSQNRSNPEPARAVEILLYTHPPVIERVRRAMEYRPWEEGRPNRFFRE